MLFDMDDLSNLSLDFQKDLLRRLLLFLAEVNGLIKTTLFELLGPRSDGRSTEVVDHFQDGRTDIGPIAFTVNSNSRKILTAS